MTNAEKLTLAKHACHIRMGVIEGTHSAKCGHPGGSLDIAEVLARRRPQRIAKRAQEQGRSDDTPEAIAKRLATYAKETAPLLDTYKSRGQLVAIDGVGDIDAIQANIVAALSD